MTKDKSFGGASIFDIRMAVIVGVLSLVGGTLAAYLAIDGFQSPLSLSIVSEFTNIIVIAAGGALMVLGIGVGQSIANKNQANADRRDTPEGGNTNV